MRISDWSSDVCSSDLAPNLVQFDRFEQRLKIAVAETLVPLALDDLEEDRPDHVLGEDLEQDAFVADIAVDQDAVLLQSLEILAVAGDALVDQLVIGLDRILQLTPARAQFRSEESRVGKACVSTCKSGG